MRTHGAAGFLMLVLVTGWVAGSTIVAARPSAPPSVALASRATSMDDIQISISQIVATGLSQPVQVTHAGDGSGRLFVVEQTGTIRIVKDGIVLPDPFLDIRSKTTSSGEQGLLGLAFHPDYRDNGRFFINYTRTSDGATIIAEVRASPTDPDRADPNSETPILQIDQPAGNHNGGQVLFGPDGYLYIGMGDGGGGGDPYENAQNPGTLLGSLLRIDVDTGTPYAVPPDNPYVGIAGRDEIWTIGLRNPWRFSFDRATGDLYIGDVGQNLWEEISFLAAGSPGGVNFGWDCLEGSHQYEWDTACAAATLTPPIAEYSHTEGRSVTGGFVYRGTLYPALVGRYFYADYVNGKIWSLLETSPGVFSAPELELDTSLLISAFGEDEQGELYVVDRGGTIRQLADANGASPPPDLTGSTKHPGIPAADPGETIPYTIAIVNEGRAVPGTVTLTDVVPAGLGYVGGSLVATSGTTDDSQAPQLAWEGTIGERETVTVTYQVQATGDVTGSLVNRASLSGAFVGPLELASAVYVPRSVLTTTMRDLFLPGTQPNALANEIANSVDCDTCHNAPVYDAWRGTMMSQAGRDPLLRAALATANADAPNAGDYCLRCHAPKGWLEGRSHPASGAALTMTDIDNGVACALCHRAVDPLPSGGESAAIDIQVRNGLTATVPITYVGSGTLIVDPADNRRGPFAFDPDLPYHSAYQSTYLGQAAAPETDVIARARLCGTCHDVDNPVLSWDADRNQYWPNAMDTPPEVAKGHLFPIERTYTEWRNSAYPAGVIAPEFAGAKADGIVTACQDCHMERQAGTATDAAFNPMTRDCTTPVTAGGAGCLPEHTMVGGNAWV
ncbi:MAG: PQQ-dependent sugar dehydrogenase, partial [Anaerolineae bacterium]|nr:PQQ-dependent sugar dehydrogenase [Anaerolineae bacterium]